MAIFENPKRLRAELNDLQNGTNTAKHYDKWAYTGGDGHIYTHPTKEGAERFENTHTGINSPKRWGGIQ